MTDEFDHEDFEESDIPQLDEMENPLTEDEPKVGIIFASNRLNVRYYENMTIQDALNQVRGKPQDEKFRILLDGQISTLDTIVPSPASEILFVGSWTLGLANKKKV